MLANLARITNGTTIEGQKKKNKNKITIESISTDDIRWVFTFLSLLCSFISGYGSNK